MPREKHHDPPIDLYVSIPKSLAIQLDLLLFDPVRGKPRYGARSEYISTLIKRDLRERKLNASQTQGTSA